MIKFVNLDYEKSNKIFELLHYVEAFKNEKQDAE